jgi:signal transduction histidine kinase
VLVTEWALGLVVPTTIALLVALCSVATRSSWRALGWAAGATVAVGAAAIGTLIPDARWDVQATVLFLVLGTATAAVAIGLTFRTRAAYLRALEDRADRLETERDQRTRLAAAAERARIAREMHDIIGHHVSIIVGLADGGAALAASRREAAEEPLRLIGDTGRQALGELRRVLGVLREGPEQQLRPQPDLGELDRLLDGVRAAGLDVTCRTAGDLNRLGPGLQLAVYRIVQEALTNTLKHAGAAAAEVTVEVTDDRQVRVRVRDHGSGGRGRPPDTEPVVHQGVLGIRERAALYGGTVTAGPAADAGWLVDVVLKEPV